MNINNNIKCKCGLSKFMNKEFCCVNCDINNTHNFLCTKFISHYNKINGKIIYKVNMKNKNPYNDENIIKTLYGKEDYLFLINDNSNSLINHCKKFHDFNVNSINRYLTYIKSKKIFLFVFPDKEIICKEFLPDDYIIKNRSKLDYYKVTFFNLLYDTTNLFDISDYDKSESHINLKGMIKFYYKICDILSNKFNVEINKKKIELSESIKQGNGDLIQGVNIGTNIAKKIYEKTYTTNNNISIINNIYRENSNLKILDKDFNDISNDFYSKKFLWIDIKKRILYFENENSLNNLKIMIFHDSFLASTLNLYGEMFKYVYCVKHIFANELVEYIKPDYILELRIERFLL